LGTTIRLAVPLPQDAARGTPPGQEGEEEWFES